MSLKKIFIAIIVSHFYLCGFAQENLVQYVNPFIGTGGHGHTYPGATLPHGMVQLSPDSRLDGWDGCSGYHYSDSFIYGFSHTHLSGTGVSDYGDILLMPMNGQPSPDNTRYGSRFSHANEKASAGYYAVLLEDDKIQTEFTVTERVGFHHYTFSNSTQNNIIIDLKHRDEVIESSLRVEDSVTISGLRRSRAWADNQYVYFVMKFSKPFNEYGIWENEMLIENIKSSDAKNIKSFVQFDLAGSNDVFVKVAISSVSIEGAKKNLEAEIPDWNFETIKAAAEQKWETELSKIEVKSTDVDKLNIFYTALYHTAIVPNINMDADGYYRGRDNKIHKAEGFVYYSVFSLWDTYRAAHPLYTIIDRERTLDYIKTFLLQYQQGGRLPVWELAGCETDCMIGYHSIPVITDAFVKGINEFDTILALEAMKKSANWDHFGLPYYIRNGMIEVDDESESVSKTLEYAYDDYCIAQFAKKLSKESDYDQYIKRAQYYKNVLDTKSGFMRPRKNGAWQNPFDPREVNNNFTEANSWQYSFYMPQDMEGYIKLTGSEKNLEKKLDNLFNASSETTGRDQSDITGLIGQYAHGNEPSHHIIYLYNYTGKAFKTQKLVHQVMTQMYKNAPDGLIGNEDCGQMSAWYVLSALGFYPVTPGSSIYMIGTPAFSLAQINLENGKAFVVNAPGNNDKNFYIQSALLSTTASLMPKKWEYSFLHHDDIANGGLITFMMGDKPATSFTGKISYPMIPLNKKELEIVINPVIRGGNISFKNYKRISIISTQKDCKIYYSLDGTEPSDKSIKYAGPVNINKSVVVKAIAINSKAVSSFVTSANYHKISHNWIVKQITPYEQQYDGGGKDGLIDEIRGTTNWRKGNWQGYQKKDMDIIIDLGKIIPINKIKMGFLQDTRSWIIMPKKINIEISTDGIHFKPLISAGDFLPIDDLTVQIKNIDLVFPVSTARYIRITAVQYGKMPAWHEGAGGDSHIFSDEIIIE